MPDIFYSLLGAVIMLALGVADMIIVSRMLYPALRERYGQARMRGRKGVPPRRVMTALWLVNLLVLPAAGFLLGARVLPALLGH